MEKQPLHITHSSNLTKLINNLEVKGEKLSWEELLCEGPTSEMVASNTFFEIRTSFFEKNYDVNLDRKLIENEFKKLDYPNKYSEIVLWFEYDLFCHINMLAVIKLIKQKKIELPIKLVCSGMIKEYKTLKTFFNITPTQLKTLYKNRVLLNKQDIKMAINVWRIYCGQDHNLLKPYIVKSSSFKYLSNCLKAHLKRFPDTLSGLNVLQKNILKIITTETIASKKHLLGYALNYQGFYGYNTLQLTKIIDQLDFFYTANGPKLELNSKGHAALAETHNFFSEIKNDMVYGGVKKAEFQFDKAKNKLVKTISNAF